MAIELDSDIPKKPSPLEPRPTQAPAEPDVEGILGQLMARTAGLEQASAELRDLIGEAPDLSTNRPGTGLRGVVATLAEDSRIAHRRTLTRTTAAAGAVVAAIEVFARLFLASHGGAALPSANAEPHPLPPSPPAATATAR
jgi:hypothetical protein